MTAKEYLKQAYRLDHRIDSDIEELGRLREMSTNISAPTIGDKVQTNRSTDAPFVKCLERIYEQEAVFSCFSIKSSIQALNVANPASSLLKESGFFFRAVYFMDVIHCRK